MSPLSIVPRITSPWALFSHLVHGHHLAGVVVPVGLRPQDLDLFARRERRKKERG